MVRCGCSSAILGPDVLSGSSWFWQTSIKPILRTSLHIPPTCCSMAAQTRLASRLSPAGCRVLPSLPRPLRHVYSTTPWKDCHRHSPRLAIRPCDLGIAMTELCLRRDEVWAYQGEADRAMSLGERRDAPLTSSVATRCTPCHLANRDRFSPSVGSRDKGQERDSRTTVVGEGDIQAKLGLSPVSPPPRCCRGDEGGIVGPRSGGTKPKNSRWTKWTRPWAVATCMHLLRRRVFRGQRGMAPPRCRPDSPSS